MSTLTAKAVATARRRALRRAHQLEKLVHEVWKDEALLSGISGVGGDPEAAELEADLGCICVDLLHPAVVALRKAAEPDVRAKAEAGVAATDRQEATCQ